MFVTGNSVSLVPKHRTRLIMTEKAMDGTVAMHYGEMDEGDVLSAEDLLPTLPNTVSSLLIYSYDFQFLETLFCSKLLPGK